LPAAKQAKQVNLMLARRLSAPKERKRFRLYGEEIKIRAKQSSGYYFGIWRRKKIQAKQSGGSYFAFTAKMED